jgi:hypothetical protein
MNTAPVDLKNNAFAQTLSSGAPPDRKKTLLANELAYDIYRSTEEAAHTRHEYRLLVEHVLAEAKLSLDNKSASNNELEGHQYILAILTEATKDAALANTQQCHKLNISSGAESFIRLLRRERTRDAIGEHVSDLDEISIDLVTAYAQITAARGSPRGPFNNACTPLPGRTPTHVPAELLAGMRRLRQACPATP